MLGGKTLSGSGGDKTQSSQGSTDFWVVKTDGSGNKQWDQRFGGTGAEDLRTIVATVDGNYLLGGWSESGITGDVSQPGKGLSDYWLVKFKAYSGSPVAATASMVSAKAITESESIAMEPVHKAGDLVAYPNPFRDKVIISFTLPQTQVVSIKVYDLQGKEVAALYQGEVQANEVHQIEWHPKAQQAAGLYIIQSLAAGQVSQQKVLFSR